MYENGLTRNTAFLENIPCCIVPTKFIRDWKQWLLKPTEVARPTIVDLKELNCEHKLIALDPNSPSDMDSSITLITRSDWDILESL
jgi:ubiquitin carboxyl-terminal hydrolase 48